MLSPHVKRFKDKLIDHFQSNRKTSWGKNEVMTRIKELYTEFLEGMMKEDEK